MKKIIIIVLGLFMATFANSTSHAINEKEKTVFTLEIVSAPCDTTKDVVSEEALFDQCREIFRRRCSYMGVNIDIYPENDTTRTNRIRVELEGVNNTERIKKLLTSSVNLGLWEMYISTEIQPLILCANDTLSALLEDTNKDEEEIRRKYPLLFLLQLGSSTDVPCAQIGFTSYQDTATVNKYLNIPEIKAIFPQDLRWKWMAGDERTHFQLYAIKVTEENGKAPLTEAFIVDAKEEEHETEKPSLYIVMNNEGTQRWAQMTQNNIGRPIAITINNQLHATPWVTSEITGGCLQILGNFSEQEAQDLAYILKSGNLPTLIKIIEPVIETDN